MVKHIVKVSEPPIGKVVQSVGQEKLPSICFDIETAQAENLEDSNILMIVNLCSTVVRNGNQCKSQMTFDEYKRQDSSRLRGCVSGGIVAGSM